MAENRDVLERATLPGGVIRWGTFPVPYVAAWSSEEEIYIAPDKIIGGRPAMFRRGGRGQGTPIFAAAELSGASLRGGTRP